MMANIGEENPSLASKHIDVITIDDDEDSDLSFVEDFDDGDDGDDDDIEIIEEIPKSMAKPKIETLVNETKPKIESLIISEDNDFSDEMPSIVSDVFANEANGNTSETNECNVCPKRIPLTKVSSMPSTSTVSTSNTSTDQMNGNTSDATPNKVIRTEGSNPLSTEEQNLDYETLYQNYLKAFSDRLIELSEDKTNDSKSDEMINRLNQIYNNLKIKNSSFVKGSQFSKLMKTFTIDLKDLKTKSRVVSHFNDLVIELNRLTQIPKAPPIKTKNKANTVNKLTEALKRVQKQIFKAENEVLDYDSMNQRTSFTDLPKLYRRAETIWAKREEILKRSTNSGRVLFKRLKYDSTPYPEVNKSAELFFNNHLKKLKNKNTKGYIDESFTFIDVRKAILDVIKEKSIEVTNCEQLIETVYRDLLTELRVRRQKDSEEVFETIETLDDLRPESFVESDPAIDLEISRNKSFYERKLQDLFQKYTNEDRKKNGESLLTTGQSEWESEAMPVDGEDFETLDVKDGDLEDEESDDKSEEELNFGDTSFPEFEQPVQSSAVGNEEINYLRDVTNS